MKKYSLTITFCNIMLSSNCSCPRPTTLLVHHTLPFLSLLTQFNIRKVLFVSLPKAVLFSISLPLLFSGSVKNCNFLHFSSLICKKLQNQPKTLSELKKKKKKNACQSLELCHRPYLWWCQVHLLEV